MRDPSCIIEGITAMIKADFSASGINKHVKTTVSFWIIIPSFPMAGRRCTDLVGSSAPDQHTSSVTNLRNARSRAARLLLCHVHFMPVHQRFWLRKVEAKTPAMNQPFINHENIL